MKHPEMVKRERDERFRQLRDRYWYRFMGVFTLCLFAVVALMYAVHNAAHAVVVSLMSAIFLLGIAIAERLARQRALDEMDEHSARNNQRPVER